jgi:hypothetical protein
VTERHIRFEGDAGEALDVATAIADAEGVDLTSSAPPVAVADGKVRLDFVVSGSIERLDAALRQIDAGLPAGNSIAFVAT